MDKFKKQPNDVLDYDVDMTNWFSSIDEDEISSVNLRVSSDGEEIPTMMTGPAGHQPYTLMGAKPWRFKIWLGGGTDQVDYKVTALVFTQQDRQKEVEFLVRVRDL